MARPAALRTSGPTRRVYVPAVDCWAKRTSNTLLLVPATTRTDETATAAPDGVVSRTSAAVNVAGFMARSKVRRTADIVLVEGPRNAADSTRGAVAVALIAWV